MMKYTRILTAVLLLAALLLTGCSSAQPAAPTEAPPVETTVPAQTAAPETDWEAIYAQPLARYRTALAEQWDEGMYFENEMSHLAAYYYEGEPLDNAGYLFVDMNGDGIQELIIGAIRNAVQDPAVFEIWTLAEGVPVMLAQSASRNRYFVEYTSEDDLWLIAHSASNGATNSADHFYRLAEGRLEVVQAVVFDAQADEENPWFLAYDNDWDTTNDTPTDEATALAILESHRSAYAVLSYIPFSELA